MRKAFLPTLAASLLLFSTAAQAQSSACDLAAPSGSVDDADVQSAINMSLGSSPCTANVAGAGVCNVVMVQRVINAKLSATPSNPLGNCLTGSLHSATLNWTASTSTGVTGYKIYRGTTSGGPYTLLTTVGTVITYKDNTVQAGLTYYYVVTAVAGGESTFSNQAQGIIPTP
jgi:hypothetical protein